MHVLLLKKKNSCAEEKFEVKNTNMLQDFVGSCLKTYKKKTRLLVNCKTIGHYNIVVIHILDENNCRLYFSHTLRKFGIRGKLN